MCALTKLNFKETNMKRILFFTLGASILFTGGMLVSSNIQAQEISSTIETPRKIEGKMLIEGTTYKWMEASFGGTNRGYAINPGNLKYQLSPNPHKDPWYNKNQAKFYALGAKQIEKQANTGKWHTKGWPTAIKNIEINGITYTLSK